jgi:hypothetical protein
MEESIRLGGIVLAFNLPAGLVVGDVMTPDPVAVPADSSISDLVEHWLSRYRATRSSPAPTSHWPRWSPGRPPPGGNAPWSWSASAWSAASLPPMSPMPSGWPSWPHRGQDHELRHRRR